VLTCCNSVDNFESYSAALASITSEKLTFENLSVLNEPNADNASIATSKGSEMQPSSEKRWARLFFAKGHESAEPDHAEAGGYSLVTAKTHTGSQACAERGSKGDDEEVGTGVQRDRYGAQEQKLRHDMPQSRIHKLGKEREEEERRLWVQNLGGDPLPERMIRIAGLGGFVHRHVAGANHAPTQPDEVNGSGIFDHGEGRGGCSEHGGKAESGREDVDRSSDEGTKRRKHALSLASGESAREDIEDAGAWGNGEQRRSCEEESQ